MLARRPFQAAARRLLSGRAKAPRDVVVLAAARTPIGSFQGALAPVPAAELGGAAVREAVKRAGVAAEDVGEVLLGNVVGAGQGQAPARQALVAAGLGWSVPATTVNKVCSSGMKATMMGALGIAGGQYEVAVSGGMESMSRVPYYVDAARQGLRLGNGELTDGLLRDGLIDAYHGVHMGMCAEHCNEKLGFTREQQDEVALESYRRSAAAWEAGHFAGEVVPVTVKGRRGAETVVDTDEEFTRIDAAKVPGLRPAFKRDGGTVTAANASTLNDGASALVLASREYAEARGLAPLARVLSFADYAHEPLEFPTAPSYALPLALRRAGLEVADLDVVEANEAFATVSLAVNKINGVPMDKLNVWGGGISLGHPIGSSGSRIIVTALSIMRQRDLTLSAQIICNAGGGASAIVLERE